MDKLYILNSSGIRWTCTLTFLSQKEIRVMDKFLASSLKIDGYVTSNETDSSAGGLVDISPSFFSCHD